MKHKLISKLILLAAILVPLSGQTWAALPISITNPGFEQPVVAEEYLDYDKVPTGWSAYNVTMGAAPFNNDAYVYNPSTTDFTAEAPEGQNVAAVYHNNTTEDKGIEQQLSSPYVAGASYQLTVKVGYNALLGGSPGYKVQLMAGNTVIKTVDETQGGVPSLGGFVTCTLDYTFDIINHPEHFALDGQPLKIRLINPGLSGDLNEVAFDDVQMFVVLADPIANAGGPYYMGNPAATLSLSGSGQPSGTATITTYEWDLDNDGQFDDASGATPATISFSDLQTLYGMVDGSNTIQLRVTDSAAKTAIAQATVELVLSTKYTGPNAVSSDTWNNAANWDNGVPQDDLNVIILSGKNAMPWSDGTPVFTGNLTLQNNATLTIGWSNQLLGSYNALGTPGVSKIFLNPGSAIRTRMGGTPIVPEIQLLGNASIGLGTSTQGGASMQFNYPITGAYQLLLQGNNQTTCLANFNTPNSFDSILASGSEGGLTIRANAAGSLGMGDVTIATRTGNTTCYGILEINASNAMADTATLRFSGTATTRLRLNNGATDTIAALIIDGVSQPAGTYGSTTSSATNKLSWIGGNGVLTVGIPAVGYWDLNGTTGGAGGTSPSGTWNAANTFWNGDTAGSGSVSAWTPGSTAIFSAGSDVIGAYTVDVVGSHDINGLVVRNGAVSLTQGSGGNLRLTANGSWSVGPGSSSIATPITQDGTARSLSVANVGSLTLSGNLSHTGGTTFAGGTLTLGGDNTAATGGTVVNGGVLMVNAANSIPGTTRNLTINSSGILAFGPSFGSGNIQSTLNDRIVTTSAGAIMANNFGSTSFDFSTAGLTAAYFGSLGDLNYTGTLTPQGNAYRLAGEGGTLTMANADAVTGASSLTVRGNVALAANNNYAGATSVLANSALSLLGSTTTSGITLNSNSALTLGNNGSLGNGTLSLWGPSTLQAVGTVDVSANPIAFNSDINIAGNGNLTLGTATMNNNRRIANMGSGMATFTSIRRDGTNNRNLVIDGSGSITSNELILGSAGVLFKYGSGTLILNGANTYDRTFLNGGTLRLNGSISGAGTIAFGAASTLQLASAANGGLPIGEIWTNVSSAVMEAVGADRSISNNINLNGDLTVTGSQSLTFGGRVLNNNGNRFLTNSISSGKVLTLGNVELSQNIGNRTLTIAGAGDTVVNGIIQNGGGSTASGLTKSGTGTLTLNGANTYAGATTVNANSGDIHIYGSTAATNITINDGTDLYVNGTTGSGSITMNGNSQLYVNGTTGSGNITMNGTSQLYVNNTTGSGNITMNNTSKLYVNGSTGAGSVTINNGATLMGTGTIGGNTTVTTGGKLEFTINSAPADHDRLDLATGRSLTFSGSSQVIVSGAATTGSYVLVRAPGGVSGTLPTLVYPDQWVAGLSFVGTDLVLTVSYNGVLPDPPVLVSIADDKGGGPVDIHTPITYTVTFSQDMNANTVSTADFGNDGTSALTFGGLVESTPGVFTLQVTPTTAGTLRLRINQGATLKNTIGLNLNTTSALLDNNTLTVDLPVNGVLAVTSGDFVPAGNPGGPFSPSSKTYTLTNFGSQSLDWTASKSADWLDLSSTSGTLASGANTTVMVSLNASANMLPVGGYFDTVSFTNTTAGPGNGLGNTTRGASLTVNGLPVVITFSGLNQTYDGTPKAVTVTTDPTPVDYTLTYNGEEGPAGEPTNAGSYDIAVTVTEPGYTASNSATLTIAKATQTINFPVLDPVGNDQSTINLTATSSSNLPVTFTSSNSNVATVSGNTVTIIGVGTTTITASQSGNGNYELAPSVQRTLSVIRTNPVAVPGGPYTVSSEVNLVLNGSGSLASQGQTITAYEWDLDDSNDGGGAFTANVTGATPTALPIAVLQGTYGMVTGNNPIRLRITDSASKTSTVSATVILTAPLRWDADANYANGQTDGTGGWLSVNQWRDVVANANTSWTSGRDAMIGNGGNGGLVYQPAPTSVGSITFNAFNGTYELGSEADEHTLTINRGITTTASSGAVSFVSPIVVGANQTWTHNASAALTFNRPITLSGDLTVDGTGYIDMKYASVGGSGGITKNGTGTLEFNAGSYTYTGQTTVNAGRLMLGNGPPIPPGNLCLSGGMLQVYWGFNLTRSIGSGAGQIQLAGGATGFSAIASNSGGAQLTFNNDVNSEVAWGSPHFKPDVLVLETGGGSNDVNFKNKLDLNGATRTVSTPIGWNGSATATATFSGIIRNSSATPAGLIKTGNSTLRLNAANTFDGGVTLQEGNLTLGNVGGLGSSVGTLTVNGGVLNLNNMASVTVGNLTGAGGIIANNSIGASTLTIGNGGATGGNFQGVIANRTGASTGTVALTKTGSGTITLSGANTHTGNTNINQGKLFINGSTAGSAVSVANGAVLGGSGTIGGALTVASGGGIEPGASASVGTLNVNNNVAITSGIWNIDINAGNSTNDLLNISGNLSVTGTQTLNVNVLAGTPSGTYTFATWTGTDPSPITWNLPQTPGTYWLGGTSLDWDEVNNWSSSVINSVVRNGKNLELNVSSAFLGATSTSNMFIEPGANVTLTGPASGGRQTVNNLTIGQGTGSNTATLTLQAGGNLTVNGATTVRSGGILDATAAGLITPTLNVSGGLVTLGHAAGNVTTANVTAGTLTVNHVGTANLSANLSGTGNLAGSAAVPLVNVIGGTPTFTGVATTMTVIGGGITTTGGTIGTFNSNTGAGTSTIGSGTTINLANVNAGTVNFNSTQTNGTLAVTGGTTNIGAGAKVTTADFSAGTGTVNGTNPLSITSLLKMAGNMTASLTGGSSFTAAGTNLANNSTARTLGISGGTLKLTTPNVPGPVVPLANIAATAANNYFGNITNTTAWLGMSKGTQAAPDKTALAPNVYQQQWTPAAGNHWGKWKLDKTASNSSFNIANVFWWQYCQSGYTNRGITRAKLYYSNMTTDPGVPGDGNPNWTKFYDNSVGVTGAVAFPLARGTANHNVTVNIDIAPVAARWIGILPTTPTPYDGNGLGAILFTQQGPPASLNLPGTSVVATASSSLDLSAGSIDHTLAALKLTAGATTTALSLKNGASLTLNGDTDNNAISATGNPGDTASIVPDVTSPPTLVIAAGKNVSVDPGVALTVQSVISGGDLTKTGTGNLNLTGTNTYSGTTTVNTGKLFVSGSTGTGAVTINSGATLGGTGTIGGDTTIAAGGNLEFNISTAPAGHDPLNIATGKGLIFSGASGLVITSSGGLSSGTYVLATGGNNIIGSAPTSVTMPPGWSATTSIVGNELRLVAFEGSGPVASFAISSIASPQTVGTSITGITITARDASSQTATSFTGTVTFGGTAGITGTSANFTNGVLSGVIVTPTVAGANLTFTVDNGAGQTGSVTFDVQSLFQDWASTNGLSGGDAASGADPDGDGWTNLQEFAFGTLPTTGSRGPLQFVVGGEVTQTGAPVLRKYTPPPGSPPFQAVFGRRKNHVAAGLTYTVEFSANLTYWTSSNSGESILTGAGSHAIEVVAVPFPETVPLSLGGSTAPPKFFRIRVATTP